MLLYVICVSWTPVSNPCAQSFPTSLIAYNLILIRVAQNRANPELDGSEIVLTSVSDSTFEHAIPTEIGNTRLFLTDGALKVRQESVTFVVPR